MCSFLNKKKKGIFKILFKLLDKSLVGLFTSDNLQFKNPEGNFFSHMKWKMCKISIERIKSAVKICEMFSNLIELNKYRRINRNKAQGIRHSKN